MMCTSRHPPHYRNPPWRICSRHSPYYRKSSRRGMFTFIRCRIENPYNLPIVKDGRNIPSERFISVQSSSRKPRDKESNGNRGKERLTVYFLKGEPIDDDPEVVKEGEGNDHRPIVTETSRGIEDEGPIRGTRTKTFRPRLTRVTSATALLLLLLHRVPPRKDN